MYKIGEFSKITSLTVKALRYYDEEGILKPSNRSDNGYRIYDENDFEKAMIIVLLRKLNFSITEIKDVLSSCTDESDLQYYLEEKKNLIKENIRKEKSLMKEIDLYITQNKNSKEIYTMDYKFEVKEIPEVKVISIRFKGNYSDVGKYIGTLYKVAKNQACGAPFNLYYDGDYKEVADIELCLPVKSKILSNEVEYKELPSIKAISTVHEGRYETLNKAYKSIIDYVNSQNMELDIPTREIYEKGPGMIFKGNPQNYITNILIPIK